MWVFNTFLLEILSLLLFPWTLQMLPPRLPLQHADCLVYVNEQQGELMCEFNASEGAHIEGFVCSLCH